MMQTIDQQQEHGSEQRPFRWRANIVLLGFLVIGAFYLITEHRAHLFGYLPFLLLLACPLLHMFMHGGHGDHNAEQSQTTSAGDDRLTKPPATGSPSSTRQHQH